jgi:hypothetical protein
VIADDLDVKTPLITLAAERFHAAREKLGDQVDHVEAVRIVEEENRI